MAILAEQFTIATASQIGREHVRTHRNNQDGLMVRHHDGVIAAVVTDGCSSAPHAEVGAQLGAAWLANWAAHHQERFPRLAGPDLAAALTQGLLRYLRHLAHRLDPAPDSLVRTAHDYLLFTFQLALITPATTLVCGVGDGVIARNGDLVQLIPDEGNAPAYLAYGLLDEDHPAKRDLTPIVHYHGPTDELHSLLIATDGAWELEAKAQLPLADGSLIGGLAAIAADPRWARNPSLLKKRLVVIGELNRHLHDDTTLVVIRRREG